MVMPAATCSLPCLSIRDKLPFRRRHGFREARTNRHGICKASYPPWRVETNRILSPLFSSYASSPSNSQSASLMRTKMPGRLRPVTNRLVAAVEKSTLCGEGETRLLRLKKRQQIQVQNGGIAVYLVARDSPEVRHTGGHPGRKVPFWCHPLRAGKDDLSERRYLLAGHRCLQMAKIVNGVSGPRTTSQAHHFALHQPLVINILLTRQATGQLLFEAVGIAPRIANFGWTYENSTAKRSSVVAAISQKMLGFSLNGLEI